MYTEFSSRPTLDGLVVQCANGMRNRQSHSNVYRHPAHAYKLNKHSDPFSQPAHLLLINPNCTRCLPCSATGQSSTRVQLVSEISKVSHRNHCRSDPVRVQSTCGPFRPACVDCRVLKTRMFLFAICSFWPCDVQTIADGSLVGRSNAIALRQHCRFSYYLRNSPIENFRDVTSP